MLTRRAGAAVLCLLLAACGTVAGPPAPVVAPPPSLASTDKGTATDASASEGPKVDAPQVDAPQVDPSPSAPTAGPTEPSPPPPPPPTEVQLDPLRVEPAATDPSQQSMLARTRGGLRAGTEWIARGVDSWFGDMPFEQGGSVTQGRLSVNFSKRERDGVDSTVRFSARFRLPNLERRAFVFIGRDNERELVNDTPGALTRRERLTDESRQEQSFFLGLGVAVRDTFETRIGFRGGEPYAQARYRKAWRPTDDDLIEFRETLFYTLDDRAGATTSLSYEHDVSPQLVLRWLNSATITQDEPRWNWSSVAGAYRGFAQQRLLSFELLCNGRRGDPVRVAEYGTQVKWLQPVHEDWLLGEVTLGHFWPRSSLSEPRARVWAIGAGLRLLF